MRLCKVAFDPAVGAFGQLMLGNGCKEARGRPALPISRFGEPRPKRLDRGQAQFVQHDAEADLVDGIDGRHAVSPIQAVGATRAS